MKVILIVGALLAIAFVVDHFDSGTNQAALSTPLPTNPIMRVRVERNLGDLTNALGDLRQIPPESPDYREAQQMINMITEEQHQPVTPANFQAAAEDNCKKTVIANEDFPSTIDWKWFAGTTSEYGGNDIIKVTVDYAASNRFGAKLPWPITCQTNRYGLVTDYHKAGR